MSFFIAITGGSCSGKTTIAKALAQRLAQSVVIAEDDYYHCATSFADFDDTTHNFDRPEAKDHALLIDHLRLARSGAAFEKPIYEFATHTRSADVQHIAPGPYLIVEGLHLLADDELRNMFDLTVFLDTDETNRKQRRMTRDIEERERTADYTLAQFTTHVQPMHARYVEPQRDHADLVLTYECARSVDEFVAEIERRVLEANS